MFAHEVYGLPFHDHDVQHSGSVTLTGTSTSDRMFTTKPSSTGLGKQ